MKNQILYILGEITLSLKIPQEVAATVTRSCQAIWRHCEAEDAPNLIAAIVQLQEYVEGVYDNDSSMPDVGGLFILVNESAANMLMFAHLIGTKHE